MKGFYNIPVNELRNRRGEIKEGQPVYVVCQSGRRSYIAVRILEGWGFEAYNFTGGFRYFNVIKNDRMWMESVLVCGMER